MTDRELLAGLDPAEAASRLDAEGPNTLAHAGRRSVLHIALGVLREPMLLLLLLGGGAYLLLGSLGEALILLAFATFSIAVTVIQETRTEHVLEALRDLSAPRALVIRGGARLRIAGRDVVRGDLIVLEQSRHPSYGEAALSWPCPTCFRARLPGKPSVAQCLLGHILR